MVAFPDAAGQGLVTKSRSVADGEAALKDARCPQFAAQIGSPTPRFAALKLRFRVPDSRFPARFFGLVFDRKTQRRRVS